MSDVPFIFFCPSDWRGGVVNLTDFEELIYFKVCLHIWDSGQPIDEKDVPRLMRSHCEGIENALETLVRFKKLERDRDGLLTNRRAKKSHREAQKRVKDARKAAANRWKHKQKRANAAALRGQSEGICDSNAMSGNANHNHNQTHSRSHTASTNEAGGRKSNGAAGGLRAGGATPAARSAEKTPLPPSASKKDPPPSLYCEMCGTERAGTLRFTECATCGTVTRASEELTDNAKRSLGARRHSA